MLAYKTGQNENQVKLPGLINGLNGSIAGSCAGFLVTPFDVVKTKLMTYSVKEQTPSTVYVFKDIIKEDGVKGLYKGAGIRMIYLGVGGFAFFGIYEKIKTTLLQRFDE